MALFLSALSEDERDDFLHLLTKITERVSMLDGEA